MANKFGAVSYAMVIVNVVAAVTNFQWTQTSKTLAFREYIRQTAVSLLCLSLVVVPSSFWIGTFEEFGQKWLLLPAGLGLADDIIAFLVGMMVAGTPSLSSSSSSSLSSTTTTTTIAPKKTWQGYTAGAVVTMGTTWLALGAIGQKYVPKIAQWCPYTQMDGLVLAAFASIVAPFGTSISTLVKRAYGHKKFGTLVAGRGGLVDLLDNQMLMAPFIYFFLSLYKFRGGSTTPGS
jgi:CDP-diglyceride synthetase